MGHGGSRSDGDGDGETTTAHQTRPPRSLARYLHVVKKKDLAESETGRRTLPIRRSSANCVTRDKEISSHCFFVFFVRVDASGSTGYWLAAVWPFPPSELDRKEPDKKFFFLEIDGWTGSISMDLAR